MLLLSQIVGVLLVLGGTVACWMIVKRPRITVKRIGGAISLGLVSILGGGLLILQERVTRLSVSKIGSIEAAAEKVEIDAKAISDLRRRVESQSATVDLVAKDAADARRSLAVVEQRSSEATAKVVALDHSVTDLLGKVNSARSEIDFSMALIRASRDDRKSFDRLLEIASSVGNPNRDVATATLVSIANDPFLGGITSEIDWKAVGVDPDSASLRQLSEAFRKKYPNPSDFLSFIHEVWKLRDFSTYEKLEFLAKIVRETDSVRFLHSAAMVMNQEAKLQKNVIAYNDYLTWWTQNSARYKQEASAKK